MKLYVAGPRSGVPDWNTGAFRSATAYLRSRGHDVTCPTELGNGAEEGMTSAVTTLPEDVYWRGLVACLSALTAADVDAVAVLPGWRRSRGARLETFVAFLMGRPTVYYPTLRRVPRPSLISAWLGRGMDG